VSGRDSDYAAILPLKTYQKNLQREAKKIKGFSDYMNEEKKWVTRFRSNYDNDKRFNKDDQPVVGVSWYAAKAWCLWLSMLESDSGDTNLYRLPTEKEWEYAAAGEEGRLYPWGKEEPSPTRANYNNNEGATTPVGRYPEGATPEGLHDMAGNVWEWTENLYKKEENWRALRGGDYSDKADALRCSSRNFCDPRNRLDVSVGFRVIRSSHSSS
jgi:formylglycine-generating enzyme required for sulfatase activity